MPGVAVLPPPPSPAGPSFSNGQNGPGRPMGDMTVAEIKDYAISQVDKVFKGTSPLQAIRSATAQIAHAKKYEDAGDLKAGLNAYTMAAALAKLAFNSHEYEYEKANGSGILTMETKDFAHKEGRDLAQRTKALEAKLAQVEQASFDRNGRDTNSSVQKTSGGSIADRMRALQDNGLSVSTTKRLSRDIPTSLSIPFSPTSISPESSRSTARPTSLQNLGVTSPTLSTTSSSNALPPPAPGPHTFVSPSTLSPPSPTSSTSSSPRVPNFTSSDFSRTFPSISELEEQPEFQQPAHTGTSTSSRYSPPHVGGLTRFPVLPVSPGPRPSSTPITPVIDHFASRPPSPTKHSAVASSSRPLTLKSSRSPLIPPSSLRPEKPELPVHNTFAPSELRKYLNHPALKVLVLDVRPRYAFDREHIRADAIVCIEPSVLERISLSGDSIEDSLSVAPRDEWTLFMNRDKFDLIAIYDDASESFAPLDSPLSALNRAIYENAFRKMLKNVPILLVGGLRAWRKNGGEVVTAEDTDAFASLPAGPSTPGNIDGSRSPEIVSRTFLNGRSRAGTDSAVRPPTLAENQARMRQSLDQAVTRTNAHSESPPVTFPSVNGANGAESTHRLVRKPTISRPPSISSISGHARNAAETVTSPTIPELPLNGSASIQYPHLTRIQPSLTGSSFGSSTGVVSPPPQASINPSPLSRRRSDYMDPSQAVASGIGPRSPIEYPDLSSQHILRPPPIAASPALERKERPRITQHAHTYSLPNAGPPPPTIQSDYPVTYWSDVQIGTSGIKNLGNTCYMNSTIQCLSATVPFARFFTDQRWKSAVNMVNPLGTRGALAHAFASIVRDLSHTENPYVTPLSFRRSICQHASQFGGSEQHDSQEFLSFLLDGLHEDLNRILNKPSYEVTPEREAELERLPQQIASEQEWKVYRMRNDSLIVDYFQGQFRNRLQCMTCHRTSTTYNAFMYLSLPVPTSKIHKVSLQNCLDNFVREEVLEKSDAWFCPQCKMKRKATKQLSLSRLPPVLLIHLKRFSFKGPFTDKIEKLVDFPLKGLDLTPYLPPPLPPGAHSGQGHMTPDDPRLQVPPYKYDLYAVTNHFGSLSSGHYTAFIASRGGWLYCDDSRVSPSEAKEVVGKPAYVLYYKRVKA